MIVESDATRVKPADDVAVKLPVVVTLPKLKGLGSAWVITTDEPPSSTAGVPPPNPFVATETLPEPALMVIPLPAETFPSPEVVTSPEALVM